MYFLAVGIRVKKESYFFSAGIGFCMLFCSGLGCFNFMRKGFFSKWAKHKNINTCNLTFRNHFEFYFHKNVKQKIKKKRMTHEGILHNRQFFFWKYPSK